MLYIGARHGQTVQSHSAIFGPGIIEECVMSGGKWSQRSWGARSWNQTATYFATAACFCLLPGAVIGLAQDTPVGTGCH